MRYRGVQALARGGQEEAMGFLFLVPLFVTAAGAAATSYAVDPEWTEDTIRDVVKTARQAGIIIAQVVAAAAPIVGLIPGIGQGVAMAMTAASSLALGKSLDDAILSTVANVVPGGLMVKTAVTTAAQAGKALIEGGGWEEAGLAALREGVRSTGGELAGAAFDAGLAIARGQSLQEAGFKVVHRWFRGSDLTDKAARFGLKLAEAAANGERIDTFLVREARGELLELAAVKELRGEVEGEIDKLERQIDAGITAILQEPARFAQSIEDLAASLGIPVEAAKASMMSVAEDEAGDLVVDHAVRYALATRVDPRAPILAAAKRTQAVEAASESQAAWWATPLESLDRTTAMRFASEKKRAPASAFDPYAREYAEGPAPAAPPPEKPSQRAAVLGILAAGAAAAVGIVLVARRRA